MNSIPFEAGRKPGPLAEIAIVGADRRNFFDTPDLIPYNSPSGPVSHSEVLRSVFMRATVFSYIPVPPGSARAGKGKRRGRG